MGLSIRYADRGKIKLMYETFCTLHRKIVDNIVPKIEDKIVDDMVDNIVGKNRS